MFEVAIRTSPHEDKIYLNSGGTDTTRNAQAHTLMTQDPISRLLTIRNEANDSRVIFFTSSNERLTEYEELTYEEAKKLCTDIIDPDTADNSASVA